MKLYTGIDLHSNNNTMAIMDQGGKRTHSKTMPNDPELILQALAPCKKDMAGIVVESTFNWYWLVDLLMDAGYRVHLANPAAIQQYKGLKHSNDVKDAVWLADMLRLGILPEGYIYPKELRPVRDLLRARRTLVSHRTSLMNSLQNVISRNCGVRVRGCDLKLLKTDKVRPFLAGNKDLALVGRTHRAMIIHLTREILKIESAVTAKAELSQEYQNLLTMPGVGKILGMTIMLETGPLSRFPKVGNYASYCRRVSSQWTSNGKVKGKGNRKNGNRYLCWAFSEAAECSRRLHEAPRAYYNRKLAKTNRMAAHNALAHKLCRAAYHIMRDQVAFDPEKLFA